MSNTFNLVLKNSMQVAVKIKFFIQTIVVILLIISPASVSSKIIVNINNPTSNQVAICLTGLSDNTDNRPSIVTRKDLEGSGIFAIADTPTQSSFLVNGTIHQIGNKIHVQLYIVDNAINTIIKSIKIVAYAKQYKKLGHVIADTVYNSITGQAPYFDSKIAYIASTGLSSSRMSGICIMDYDGGEPGYLNHPFLHSGQHYISCPRVLNADNVIVFCAKHKKGRAPASLYLITKAGKRCNLRKIPTQNYEACSPSCTKNGNKIAFSVYNKDAYSGLYIYDVNSRHIIDITGRSGFTRWCKHIETSPSFSANGDFLVFNSDVSGQPQIYITKIGDNHQQRISHGHGLYFDPRWSPVDNRIACIKRDRGGCYIAIIDLKTLSEEIVVRAPRGFIFDYIDWAPNGCEILCSIISGRGVSRLYRINLNNKMFKKIATPTYALTGSWSNVLH